MHNTIEVPYFDKTGSLVRIRTYQDSDLEALIEVGKDEIVWEFYRLGEVSSTEEILKYVNVLKKTNRAIDFVVIDISLNRIIGFSAIQRINWETKTGEIGSTFIHSDYWGKGHNQESKQMIMDIGFNELGLEKLKYVCNVLNKRSYFAALKLGFEFIKIEEKGRENVDGTWADFAHFELKKIVKKQYAASQTELKNNVIPWQKTNECSKK